ncbi:unnamed protein product [Discosporangium mesarthrocarpum]
MGAGLAAQRGWPQGDTSEHTSDKCNEREFIGTFGVSPDNELLKGWGTHTSSVSFGAVETLEGDYTMGPGVDVDGRIKSDVAYGMRTLSTEEEGMAFATVAGIPLVYGLYIVWAPPFIQSLWGVSLHVSYGPFALMGLLMSDSLGNRGFKSCDGICRQQSQETQDYLDACMLVTFLVGMCYFIMAIFNMGEPLAILLADPVISGFVTASAILVANSQVCSFLQIQHPAEKDSSVFGTLQQAWGSRGHINLGSVAVGLCSMAFYFFLRRCNAQLRKRGVVGFFLPEALLVVVVATAISWIGDLKGRFGIDIVGHIPPGLPSFTVPLLNYRNMNTSSARTGEDALTHFLDMAGVALTAAMVSFIITHSIAKSLAGATEVKAGPELVAFGFANTIGSFFLALPCCASLSRAAMIDALGARTLLHNVVTFGVMTLVLLYITPLLEYLPTTVLAATIYAVIYKFFDFREPWRLYHISTPDLLMWLATFGATLVLSVRAGILVGMGASALTLIQSSSRPMIMNMGNLPRTDFYRDVITYPEAVKLPGLEVLRFGASLNFANKDTLRRAVIKLVEKSDKAAKIAQATGTKPGLPLQYIILDSSSIHSMDFSSMKMLEALVTLLLDRSPPVEILLAPVSDPLIDQIMKSPVLRATLGKRYFLSIHAAVKHASARLDGGLLLAPASAYHAVMSHASLAMLDENQQNDF